MRQVGYLQRLYRDVRSTEHKIHITIIEEMKVQIQVSKHKTYKIKYYVDITKIFLITMDPYIVHRTSYWRSHSDLTTAGHHMRM
jgi:hypothetical protein